MCWGEGRFDLGLALHPRSFTTQCGWGSLDLWDDYILKASRTTALRGESLLLHFTHPLSLCKSGRWECTNQSRVRKGLWHHQQPLMMCRAQPWPKSLSSAIGLLILSPFTSGSPKRYMQSFNSILRSPIVLRHMLCLSSAWLSSWNSWFLLRVSGKLCSVTLLIYLLIAQIYPLPYNVFIIQLDWERSRSKASHSATWVTRPALWQRVLTTDC